MVPEGQAGELGCESSLHTGRQIPVPVPASAPTGITQLSPAAQPAQLGSLQPEFCVQAAPWAPRPGHAQSVVSPAKTKQERPGAQPVPVVGSQGREQAENGIVVPQRMGTLQKASTWPQDASSLQKRRQVVTLHPAAVKVRHWDPGAQSLLLAQGSPGWPAPPR